MSDEAVLFIHSTGTGPYLWSSVPDDEIGGRRKVLPANLGYPPGELVPRGHTVTVGDDAAHVLRSVDGIGRVHIVAHSYGALVGLHVIAALGERAASAFLYEPVTFGGLVGTKGSDPEAVAQAHEFASHPWFLHDAERGGGEEWLEMFIDYWNRPGAWSNMPEQVRAFTRPVGWKMFQEVRACFDDPTPLDAWRLPPVTTVAFGARTTVASRAMSRALARGRSEATLVELAGLNHMAPLTNGAKVLPEIARHFERVGR